MRTLVIRILAIGILAPFAGIAALLGYLEFAERQQIETYYAKREILRAVHQSTRDLKHSGNASADAANKKAAKRQAFLEKLPVSTSREIVYRRLAAENMSCVPESATNNLQSQCMAIGHSNDFRWYFVLRFDENDRLLDAEIRTLKGA